MIRPLPRCRMTGITRREARMAAKRLRSNTNSQSSSDVSQLWPPRDPPTLLTRISMPPKVETVCCTMRSISYGLVISA